MKAVLISIQPIQVGYIAEREKRIVLSKVKPKLETPFKCYIYCTNAKPAVFGNEEEVERDMYGFLHKIDYETFEESSGLFNWNGKVVGEFICVNVEKYDETTERIYYGDICLTEKEYNEYADGKPVYGWEFCKNKIYNKPKELSEFKLSRPPRTWCYVEVEE
jgi:predicted transcriptional regulator